MASLVAIDFNKLCRICLSEKNEAKLLKIYPEENFSCRGQVVPIYLKIMACAAIQIRKSDNLPQQICLRCEMRIEDSCKLKELIELSDAQLKNFLNPKDASSLKAWDDKFLQSQETSKTELVLESDVVIDHVGGDSESDVSFDEHKVSTLPSPTEQPSSGIIPNLDSAKRLASEERKLVKCNEQNSESDVTPSEDEVKLVNKVKQGLKGRNNPQYTADLFCCKLCSKSFNTARGLSRHQAIHEQNNLKCPNCEKTFAYKRLLTQHMLVHKADRSFLCSVCGKAFKTKGQMSVHTRVHSNDRPFPCKFCDKKFYQLSHRNQHMRSHTDERPFSCTQCGKSFRIRSSLRGHMNKHSGVQPYQCATCGKKFSLRSSLKNHVDLHSGEKRFKCDQCEKRFALSSSLRIHLKVHSADNVNVCATCGKRFSDAHHLEEHERTHGDRRDFVCSTCGKAFKQSVGLTMHMKTHNPERPYQCDLCDKSFVMRQTFEVHYRRHTEVKPYACLECGKTFRQSGTLKTHALLHSSERPFSCTCRKSFVQRSKYENHAMVCLASRAAQQGLMGQPSYPAVITQMVDQPQQPQPLSASCQAPNL